MDDFGRTSLECDSLGGGHFSGQNIATSHDLGPQNVAFWKGNPRNFQGNLGW